jgi:hypothetical protein
MVAEAVNYLEAEIEWENGTDPEYPYFAEFAGERCLIRLNDFPDDNLYTLIVDGVEIAHFDDWPEFWSRPVSYELREPETIAA